MRMTTAHCIPVSASRLFNEQGGVWFMERALMEPPHTLVLIQSLVSTGSGSINPQGLNFFFDKMKV